MIKLKDVKKLNYEEVAGLINRKLKEIPSKNLELDFLEYHKV